jgi:transketolase
MRDSFTARLEELAAADPRIMLITGDLGFGVLDSFEKKLPKQYLNVGVAEQNMTGVATGIAMEGRIVFTYSIGNFPTLRCLEQIRNDAAYHDANVKIVAIGGGFSYGALGMSHHATEDLAIMRAIGIPVVAPGCNWEAAESVNALVGTPGTCYLRLDRASAGSTGRPGEKFELGRARILRTGTDVTLIATGGILAEALAAEDLLRNERGINCRVLSMHTVSPLDVNAVLAAARETGGIVTVEEHTIHGGLGAAVAEACLDSAVIPRGFARVALRQGFSSIVGGQEFLRTYYGLDKAAIAAAAESLCRPARLGGVGEGRGLMVG